MAPAREAAHAIAKPTEQQKKADAEQARLIAEVLLKRTRKP